MARFKARDIVFIRGRNLAVVTGKIIEGSFRVGDCVQIPQPPMIIFPTASLELNSSLSWEIAA